MAEYEDHRDVDTTSGYTDSVYRDAELSSKKSFAGASVNGDSHHKPHSGNGSVYDPDAQQLVISSLRTQIQDLVGQVTQLNNKLVKSYDRVSDLEDELHVTAAQLRNSSVKVSQLELERSQHLSALSTGLLVEKSHVTSELNRLMEKATDEAAQRGQAESARAAIEKELDDLSANLFNQANTMVAEARYAQHLNQRKTEEAEAALKSAEEAVSLMQLQLQTLREEKEVAEKRAKEIQVSIGKGKWVEVQRDGTNVTRSLRLLSSHLPYQEFMLFVAHLRSVHLSTPLPPLMSTLLALPFLQRLLTEDSEPTLRLDLAPSLNWLSRRSVLAAIYSGQLFVEPMSPGILLSESTSTGTMSGINNTGGDIPCALCGSCVFSKEDILRNLPTAMSRSNGGSNSWSTSLFKKSQNNPYPSQGQPMIHRSPSGDLPQVFIFRVALSQTTSLPSLPMPMQASGPSPPQHFTAQSSNTQSSTIYPLCRGSWCLTRLRTTCQLWSFVRTGIVEKIWDEELPLVPPPPRITVPAETSKPPVPPRRKGFWGMASVLGEKAATWGEAAKKIAPSTQSEPHSPTSPQRSRPSGEKFVIQRHELGTKLPPPPPTHPAIAAAYGRASPTSRQPAAATLAPPPPLPKRSEGRSHAKSPSPPSPKSSSPTPADVPIVVADQLSENVGITSSAHQDSKEATASSPPPITTPSPINANQPSGQTSPPSIPRRAVGHKRHSSLLPERIPLPDSRPGTPTLNGGPPSRPSSPAPAGAAPPPIPRRAAARGGSKLTTNNLSEPISTPGMPPVHPMPTVTPVVEEKDQEPKKAGNEDNSDAQRQAQSSESGKVPESNGEVQGPAVVEEKNQESRNEENSDAQQQAQSSEPGKAPESDEEAQAPVDLENPDFSPDGEKSVNATTDSLPSSKEQAAVVTQSHAETESKSPTVELAELNGEIGATNADATPNADDSDASNRTLYGSSKAASPFSPSPGLSNGAVDHATSNGEQSSEERAADTKELLVGEATWEERTWKELVRLREDMFWARVGGLR